MSIKKEKIIDPEVKAIVDRFYAELGKLTNDGVLDAYDVVAFARKNPQSAVADMAEFEWDDRKAAEEYRRWQAGALLEGGKIGVVFY